MAIDKKHSRFILYCDICGDMADKDFDTFGEALGYQKSIGWKSQRTDGIWEDVCPACQVLVKG